jgi:hypothetical protein
MAKITFNPNETTSPAWAKDYGDREHLLPGGVRLAPGDFALTNGKRFVASGTLIGRTYAERDAGTGFGPATLTTGTGLPPIDDEIYLLWQDVADADANADADVYRHGSLVATNFLSYTPTADQLTAIRNRYQTTIGVR